MEKEDTTIKVSKQTVKRLQKLGSFGDSWNDLLNEMAEFIEDHEDEWFEEEEEGGEN